MSEQPNPQEPCPADRWSRRAHDVARISFNVLLGVYLGLAFDASSQDRHAAQWAVLGAMILLLIAFGIAGARLARHAHRALDRLIHEQEHVEAMSRHRIEHSGTVHVSAVPRPDEPHAHPSVHLTVGKHLPVPVLVAVLRTTADNLEENHG